MLAGDADAGQHSEAMLNRRGRACTRRRGRRRAPPQPRTDDVAPRHLRPFSAPLLRPARRVRPRALRRRQILRHVLAAPPVPRAGTLRRSLPRPAPVVEVHRRRQRRGAAGVELSDGGDKAVSGEPAAAPGELPHVPAEPAGNDNDVVFES